ncbi:VanZ family protein [Deinococcus radiomollis]|uniref:VanZ family protein n=1 Tax=Deinococcus radiomollis TaxID=468916 RepID=UPI003892889A
MAVVWTLSSSSTPLGVPLRHPFDWLGHSLEYLVLAYALGRAGGRRGLALGLAVWFGASDEVHQAFVAGRDAGIQDWLFDLLGAWLGSRLSNKPGSRPVRRPPEDAPKVTPLAQTEFWP